MMNHNFVQNKQTNNITQHSFNGHLPGQPG